MPARLQGGVDASIRLIAFDVEQIAADFDAVAVEHSALEVGRLQREVELIGRLQQAVQVEAQLLQTYLRTVLLAVRAGVVRQLGPLREVTPALDARKVPRYFEVSALAAHANSALQHRGTPLQVE